MSTLHVENLKGLSSGSNANKIIVPSGQTLDASNGFVAPAGHVIQVVQGLGNTGRQTYSSTSYQDIIIVSITPKFSTSKVLVTAHTSLNRTTSAYINGIITRGSTQILSLDTQAGYIAGLTNNEHSMGSLSGEVLDAPSTTSATTYKLQLKVSGGSGSIFIDGQPQITAMEIAQ